ncbi:DNA alkylation repair protein [Pseudonocardia sp. GCM10023141]|uniref:DNA alkylation repair protein n=1 Tax=Pseudonocardia sp. GCM10023141 TaxID=3252653 RepID=UPI00361E63DE
MTGLVEQARAGLAELADPVAAEQMRAYMKSPMPFRGVPKPARDRLLRVLVAEHPPADADALRAAVTALWTGARYREERYLALSLTSHRRYERLLDLTWLPVWRKWIVEGAWWDFTDEIANRRIGPLLRAHPAELLPTLRAWAVDADRWLRRTSIICQLGSRGDIDLDLLTATIEANVDDPDFFLRKAIGWALRQHAKTDPDWVREFVAQHPGLSPLSRKEALKHVG